MSAIAGLFNVPSTQQELDTWAFCHAAHHRDINRRLQELLPSVRITEYILDPMDPQNLSVWLDQHQQLHQQTDSLLGIASNDLLDVNWEDQNERAGWIFLNSSEHYQAANILQIG